MEGGDAYGKDKSKPIPEHSYDRFKLKLEEVSGKYAERNMMIFYLDVATGYRVQDVADLTIGDIFKALRRKHFEIQEKKALRAWECYMKKHPKSNRKRPKPRTHDIASQLASMLQEYIKHKNKSEYAFPSNKGNGCRPITAKSYSDILKSVADDPSINLEHITGHSLRKTYARRLYDATGKDIEYVRIALGHKTREVTKVYLGIDDDVKESAAKIAASKL